MAFKEHFLKNYGSYMGIGFFFLVAWILQDTITGIRWDKVYKGLSQTPLKFIFACIFLTGISFSFLSLLDYLGLRKATSETNASPLTKFLTAFVCYVANFNFGGLLGAVGMRLKLYTDLEISKSQIVRIGFLSTISNWIGYCAVAGAFFALTTINMPSAYNLDSIPWKLIGYGSMALVIGYLFLIFRKPSLTFFSKNIPIPVAKEGLVRLILGSLNWLTVTSILFLIFTSHLNAPLEIVITSYFTAAIAGVITHIPAGLGVFEAIFLSLLSPHIGSEDVMSGILTYRAIYYLLPLVVGIFIISWLKLHQIPNAKGQRAHG